MHKNATKCNETLSKWCKNKHGASKIIIRLRQEAEVKASVEAWESANAAKVSAKKAAKSAESRAKKAKKALADADQKRAKRE
jgi:hypothetical protein